MCITISQISSKVAPFPNPHSPNKRSLPFHSPHPPTTIITTVKRSKRRTRKEFSMMINGAHSTPSGDGGAEMSVLERETAVFKWQRQQTYFSDFSMLSSLQQTQQLNELLMPRPMKPDPGLESGFGSGLNYGISRTASCPPAAAKEIFRKRKADHKTLHPPKAETENESRAKKVKVSCEEDDAFNKNSRSSSKNGDKESKSKEVFEPQKPDYIHVRARRGQATDSHSLAERVRREKISERMKYLQDLVPGCNKITGKAGMLDEIINYVQSLQRQVEFLSMKLAAVSPTLDFNIEELFTKEVCSSNFPGSEITSEMANVAYLQFNQGHQMCPVFASDLGMSEVEMGLQQSISAPVSIPETYLDSSCLTQTQTYLPWDQSDVQTMYNMDFQQARQLSYPSQTHTGAN